MLEAELRRVDGLLLGGSSAKERAALSQYHARLHARLQELHSAKATIERALEGRPPPHARSCLMPVTRPILAAAHLHIHLVHHHQPTSTPRSA